MVSMRWGLRLIGIVSTAILARLLTPEDFGLVAMGTLVIGLVGASLNLGGAQLPETLENFAQDERATVERHVTMALAWLENLDPARARRVAKAVVASPRFAKWAEVTRKQIRTLAGDD